MASGRSFGTGDPEVRPKRRRLPGVNLRPGTVKQARLEAGLSLAQLGRGHVTAPAIYLIETGRTRPSLPTLEHIARRTGKPVEFFLAQPGGTADDAGARVLELEAMIEEGLYDDAIAAGVALLERPPSAFQLGRIRYYLAQAYAGLGKRDQALSLLAEAKAQFESVNDRLMVGACLGVQAALNVAAHPKEAVALAESAVAVARTATPAPVLTESSLLAVLGDARAADHDWDGAIAAYEDAIKFSASAFDLRRVARTYRTLAAAHREAGDFEKAGRFAMRATALLEIMRFRSAHARSVSRLAEAMISRGDLAAARQHLDRTLELCRTSGLDAERSDVLLALSELAEREGDSSQAEESARQALDHAERGSELATAAEAHVRLGRIADRRGEHEAAEREFEAAIQGFEALGMRERLQQTHGMFAEVLERRGELAKAYEHMKQALQASRPTLMRTDHEEERVSSA